MICGLGWRQQAARGTIYVFGGDKYHVLELVVGAVGIWLEEKYVGEY